MKLSKIIDQSEIDRMVECNDGNSAFLFQLNQYLPNKENSERTYSCTVLQFTGTKDESFVAGESFFPVMIYETPKFPIIMMHALAAEMGLHDLEALPSVDVNTFNCDYDIINNEILLIDEVSIEVVEGLWEGVPYDVQRHEQFVKDNHATVIH